MLRTLRDNDIIERYFLEEELEDNDATQVGKTSDPAWPEAVRDSWPYFIMGVSWMLLELIGMIKQAMLEPLLEHAAPIQPVESFYSELRRRVGVVWRDHGGHALFHHVNALFGYEPVAITPRAWSELLMVI
jgi:hypothetical protein